MTPTQDTTKGERRAAAVHAITQTVLSEPFSIERKASLYEQADSFDVLIAAAVERLTIEMASALLAAAPRANPVRTYVNAMLTDGAALRALAKRVNERLVSRLPKSLLKRKWLAAIDLTEIGCMDERRTDGDECPAGPLRLIDRTHTSFQGLIPLKWVLFEYITNFPQ